RRQLLQAGPSGVLGLGGSQPDPPQRKRQGPYQVRNRRSCRPVRPMRAMLAGMARVIGQVAAGAASVMALSMVTSSAITPMQAGAARRVVVKVLQVLTPIRVATTVSSTAPYATAAPVGMAQVQA